jgi:hypothetical protein
LFYKDGVLLSPEHREEGMFLLLNSGREDFELEADVAGYERYHGYVHYQDLDEHLPVYAVYLLPRLDLRKGEPVLSYEDRIPGLEALEAITLMRPSCAANEYHAKKQELSVFRTDGSRSLPDVHYGLLQGQKDTYLHIEVEKDISEVKVKLAKPLEGEVQANAPIYRVIFGQIDPDGTFNLRVRESANEIPVIIRFRKDGEWYSLKGEFHSLTVGMAEQAAKRETEGGDISNA